MKVKFPGFEKVNAWYLYKEVAGLSDFITIFVDGHGDPKNPDYIYGVTLHEPSGDGVQVRSTISIYDDEEFYALHDLLTEMLRLKPLIERGIVESTCIIKAKSKKFTYVMHLEPESWLTMSSNEDGTFTKNGVVKNSPSTGSISVNVETVNGTLTVGHISLYSGFKTALLMAHDLSVVMAFINGVPAEEIIRMKPQVQENVLSGAERERVLESNLSEVDWDEIRQVEKEGLEYVSALKMNMILTPREG